jgi:hypothetical protein
MYVVQLNDTSFTFGCHGAEHVTNWRLTRPLPGSRRTSACRRRTETCRQFLPDRKRDVWNTGRQDGDVVLAGWAMTSGRGGVELYDVGNCVGIRRDGTTRPDTIFTYLLKLRNVDFTNA